MYNPTYPGPILSQSNLSAIQAGKREISAAMADKLGAFFVSARRFLCHGKHAYQ